jgi:hypothetical protein
MTNQLIDGDQAIVATCITAATMLALAQGRADFIFPALSANNPATVQAGGFVPLTFVPSSIDLFNTSSSTLIDVDIIPLPKRSSSPTCRRQRGVLR